MKETPIRPIRIISDQPEADDPAFGFDAYARTIGGVIVNRDNPTPLVIGIYGAWGSGKTTLMRSVKGLLDAGKHADAVECRRCKTVWFQAWKYAREEEILAGLIEEIFRSMKSDGFLAEFHSHVEKLIGMVNVPQLSKALLKIVGGDDIGQSIGELAHKKKLGFYDSFQDFFEKLIWDYLSWRPQISELEKWDDQQGALTVFIDDLDRCPVDRIVTVLETIKLFLDKPGCVFVIGAAHDIILRALEKTYQEDAVRFMDKIVQVSFNLPQVPVADFEAYIAETLPDMKETILPFAPVIIPAVQNNPRQLKRFLNNLNLMEGIRENRGDDIDIQFPHLLFWSIIEYVSPALRKEIVENDDVLTILREPVRRFKRENPASDDWTLPEAYLDAETIPQHLHGYLRNRGLAQILYAFDANPRQLRQLITLSGMVAGVEEMEGKRQAEAPGPVEGTTRIPAGSFPYGDPPKETTIDAPFRIDLYPVTNERFKQFIDEGGYNNQALWSEEGWRWREQLETAQPQRWTDPDWNAPGQPVVGVSYYEAEAFARWKGGELPTEIQWERAARGTDHREYPWGDGFKPEACNTRESETGKTSRVTRYPNGVSPAGCYDMAGNVSEWTLSPGDRPGTERMPRGGNWASPAESARCSARSLQAAPHHRGTKIGFRCIYPEP